MQWRIDHCAIEEEGIERDAGSQDDNGDGTNCPTDEICKYWIGSFEFPP